MFSKFLNKDCFSSCVYHLFPVCFCLSDTQVSYIYKITTILKGEDWAKYTKYKIKSMRSGIRLPWSSIPLSPHAIRP